MVGIKIKCGWKKAVGMVLGDNVCSKYIRRRCMFNDFFILTAKNNNHRL